MAELELLEQRVLEEQAAQLNKSRCQPNSLNNKMAFGWKAAGITYNKYLSIASRVVRRSLKEGPRLQAERRGEMELRFAKWSNGKQGENKSLAEANADAAVQAAAQEAK